MEEVQDEFVVSKVTDQNTGLTFVEDVRGFFYLLPSELADQVISEFYLYQTVKNYTWPNVQSFHSLPTPLISMKNVDTYISSIVASHGYKNSYGVGSIGAFVDGNLKLALPFERQLNYIAYKPILIPAGQTVEIKYLPFNRRAELSVTVALYEIL